VRKADYRYPAREANGFVTSAFSSASVATVYFSGLINGYTSLQAGYQYLSGSGQFTASYPTQSGHILQKVGTSVGATTLNFSPEASIILSNDPTGSSDQISVVSASYAITSSNVSGLIKQTFFMPAGAMTTRTLSGSTAGSFQTTSSYTMLSTQDFDAAEPRYSQFNIGMPPSWNLGTVTSEFVWTCAVTGSTGSVVWAIQAKAASHGVSLDLAWSNTASVVSTFTSGSFSCLSSETTAITVANSPASKDTVFFQVWRDPLHSSDTFPLSASLVGTRVYMTVSNISD